MKKRNVSKLLVTSILGAAIGASALVGGTYAIFTSEAKTEISVTSAKVSVNAGVKNIKLYSAEWDQSANDYTYTDVTDTGAFTNGGTAVFADGALTLDKISPMDRVEFDFSITNDSNINVQYRSFLRTVGQTNALSNSLKITIDGIESTGSSFYTNWASVQVGDPEVTMHTVIELPAEAGNEVQDLTAKLVYGVEAVQGNAHVMNETSEVNGVIYNELDEAIEAASNGGKVSIQQDIEREKGIATKEGQNISFDFNGHALKVSSSTANVVDVKEGSHIETIENAILEGKSVVIQKGSSVGTIKNSTIKGTSYVEPIQIMGKSSGTSEVGRLENLTITGSAPKAIYVSGYVTDTIEVKNCTYNGHPLTAVDVDDDQGRIVFITDSCEINGVSYEKVSDAINAAEEGQTITLTQDLTETITIPSGKKISLDLAGHKIVAKKSIDASIDVKEGAELVSIENATLEGRNVIVQKGGVIGEIKNCTIKGTSSISEPVQIMGTSANTGAILKMTNVNIEGTNEHAIFVGGFVTIPCTLTNVTYNGHAITLDDIVDNTATGMIVIA